MLSSLVFFLSFPSCFLSDVCLPERMVSVVISVLLLSDYLTLKWEAEWKQKVHPVVGCVAAEGATPEDQVPKGACEHKGKR